MASSMSVLVTRTQVVDQGRDDRRGEAARRRHGDALGDRGAAERAVQVADRVDHRGIEVALDTDHLDVRAGRRCAATAMPAMRPPPPTGTTITSRSGASASSSSADRPLARDDVRVVVGVDEHEALASARARRARSRGLGEVVAVEHDPRAECAGALTLVKGVTSASRSWRECRGAARGRRHPGHGCRPTWRRRRGAARRRVSCCSLLSAPRSLNEAVYCRFSNFSHTLGAGDRRRASPTGSVGVRTTLPRIASAARRTSAAVTASDVPWGAATSAVDP